MSANMNAINHVDNKEQMLQEVIGKYKNTPGSLRNVINEAREIYGDLPVNVQVKITAGLGFPITKTFGVVSFTDSQKLKKEQEYLNQLTEGITFSKTNYNVLLKNFGIANPDNIEDYLLNDGYKALEQVLERLGPREIINIVKDSGLRGRSGKGIPTGQKWEVVESMPDQPKYVCCYAEEGDLSGVKDRFLIENNSHAILEAMVIAGYATGAHQGFVYMNASWKTAAKRLRTAIDQAKREGLLGSGIRNTYFDFEVDIRFGENDFIPGEETSLISVLEGNRGEPLPIQSIADVTRLWQKPVLVNNVETLMNIPGIIREGIKNPSDRKPENTKETKVLVLTGDIRYPAIVEVPLGITLQELIFDIGGGAPKGKNLKAVLIGGIMGACVPAGHLESKIDYQSAEQTGLPLVAGGFIVMDEDTSIVDMVKISMELISGKTCGKCPTCRIGTKRMFEILRNVTEGKGKKEDIKNLEILAGNIKRSTSCGFGYNAPDIVLSTLEHYAEEYAGYIKNNKLHNGQCQPSNAAEKSCERGLK